MRINKKENEKINDLIGLAYAAAALKLDSTNQDQKETLNDLAAALGNLRNYINEAK